MRTMATPITAFFVFKAQFITGSYAFCTPLIKRTERFLRPPFDGFINHDAITGT